jgi:hypothetical protein
MASLEIEDGVRLGCRLADRRNSGKASKYKRRASDAGNGFRKIHIGDL